MPQLDVYRQQQTAQNELRVVRNAQPSAAAAEVVGETITAFGELGMRIQEARAEQEAANLEIEAGRRYDSLYRELEQDGEGSYEDFEKRMSEGSSKLRGELLGKVKSKAVRDAFDLRLKGMESGYIVRTRDLMQRRGVEEVKAGLIGRMASLEDTAKDMSVLYEETDPTKTETRTFTRERDVVKAEIRSMQAKGFIGKDDAAVYLQKVDDLAKQADSDRILNEIDNRLDAGESAAAEEYFKLNYGRILPEVREKTESVLEAKTLEHQSVTIADELWDKSGQNYGEFLNLVRADPRIKDPEMLQRVEGRGSVRLNQMEAATAANDKAHLEEGMRLIVDGKPIPSDLRRRASGTVIDRLDAEVRTRALWSQQMATASAQERAALREISKGNYYALKAQLVDPEMAAGGLNAILADPGLAAMYDTLGPDERGQLLNEIAGAATPATADKTLKAYKSVAALASAYMPESLTPKEYARQFGGLGEGDPGVAYISANRAKAPGALTFEKELMRLVDAETQRLGAAEITADRAKQLVALAYAEAGKQKDGSTKYPIGQDVAAGIVTTDSARVAMDYRNRNPAIWREATTLVRSQYPNASDELILEEARRIEQQLAAIRAGRGERGRFPME